MTIAEQLHRSAAHKTGSDPACPVCANKSKFRCGDKVIDLDGRRGTVVKVTQWEGSTWYDVRFAGQGEAAVRYDGDLCREAGA